MLRGSVSKYGVNMINISDMDLNEFKIKDGDIKVDGKELKSLFALIGRYHDILCGMTLNQEEETVLREGLRLVEQMQNKYIVMGDLRMQQKHWYDVLQMIDSGKIAGIEKEAPEKVDALRREVYGFYLEAKQKREVLSKELKKMASDGEDSGAAVSKI